MKASDIAGIPRRRAHKAVPTEAVARQPKAAVSALRLPTDLKL